VLVLVLGLLRLERGLRALLLAELVGTVAFVLAIIPTEGEPTSLLRGLDHEIVLLRGEGRALLHLGERGLQTTVVVRAVLLDRVGRAVLGNVFARGTSPRAG